MIRLNWDAAPHAVWLAQRCCFSFWLLYTLPQFEERNGPTRLPVIVTPPFYRTILHQEIIRGVLLFVLLTLRLEASELPNQKTIEVFPPTLALEVNGPAQTLVISEIQQDGLRIDHSHSIQLDFPAKLLELDERHRIRAIGAGTGSITAAIGPKTIDIPFTVPEAEQAHPQSFVRDILPILSRAGCNGGSCHAKPNGQNSFQLSVFAFDPKSDYHEIVKDARGRRVFASLPESSLLLLKPTMAVPHKGGKRLEPGTPFYEAIVQWIREGMVYQNPEEPTLTTVAIAPAQGRFPPNSEHQLRVTARYSDGSERDITSMAEYGSSDKEIVVPDEEGSIRFTEQSGEAVILARYMGHVGQLRATVPSTIDLDDPSTPPFISRNFIDELAQQHFQRLRLLPSGPCDDATFLRRSTLDAIGRLPTVDEAKAFLADDAPDKRSRWIQSILDDPRYGDYWANKWADLLRPNPFRVGMKSTFVLDRWLRESFRNNMPFDEFAAAIVGHRGSNHGSGPAVIYRDRRQPTELTSLFSQVFLGVRMECAKCHHHPFEKWSQSDFYQFAAYFASLKQKGAGLSPPISAGTEGFYFGPGGSVKHPLTDQVLMPRALTGTEIEPSPGKDPRQELADWMTSPENPYFSKAAVNRVWSVFFSRGFVNPVDDFRDSNPPVNEALLDALASAFVAHNFDLKWLMATIMDSALYQRSDGTNATNVRDTKNFSRFYRKRLPAEVLLDAICDITNVPETFKGLPPGSRAMEVWTYQIDSHFLSAFGRPNANSDPPNERDDRSSVVQALHLMHSEGLQKKLSHPDGWPHALATSEQTSDSIIDALYLATFSRYPTNEEREIAQSVFPDDGASRQEAVEDVLWALLNTAEFIFKH